VQVGLSDGTNTEIVAGNLQPGDTVVMNAITATSAPVPSLAATGPAPGTRR
jgi:multidrug efflux pump subunit AcrA (membrane-fusion protein)